MKWKTNTGSNYLDAGLFIDEMYILSSMSQET